MACCTLSQSPSKGTSPDGWRAQALGLLVSVDGVGRAIVDSVETGNDVARLVMLANWRLDSLRDAISRDTGKDQLGALEDFYMLEAIYAGADALAQTLPNPHGAALRLLTRGALEVIQRAPALLDRAPEGQAPTTDDTKALQQPIAEHEGDNTEQRTMHAGEVLALLPLYLAELDRADCTGATKVQCRALVSGIDSMMRAAISDNTEAACIEQGGHALALHDGLGARMQDISDNPDPSALWGLWRGLEHLLQLVAVAQAPVLPDDVEVRHG